ncbi:MAG: polymer-forming cytoskeletal protein [Oscillospiraceae bacterium]|nr:polymer-forming cytoskeletal protein [Oscillospiraceae bacterium]
MGKKDNFSQAMFEMFGLGKAPEDGAEENTEEIAAETSEEVDELNQLENFEPAAPISTPSAAQIAAEDALFNNDPPAFDTSFNAVNDIPAPAPVSYEPAPAPAPAPAPVAQDPHGYVRRENCTYFAPGTSMEGTLRSDSDVEIVGDFKGEIASDGKVTIHSNTQSSIAAAELVLVDCTLTGDAMVGGDVSINEKSSVTGNIRAANIVCSGVIRGNLNVQSNITLTENAQVIGDIKTGTLAMSRGAKVSGKIDMGN